HVIRNVTFRVRALQARTAFLAKLAFESISRWIDLLSGFDRRERFAIHKLRAGMPHRARRVNPSIRIAGLRFDEWFERSIVHIVTCYAFELSDSSSSRIAAVTAARNARSSARIAKPPAFRHCDDTITRLMHPH